MCSPINRRMLTSESGVLLWTLSVRHEIRFAVESSENIQLQLWVQSDRHRFSIQFIQDSPLRCSISFSRGSDLEHYSIDVLFYPSQRSRDGASQMRASFVVPFHTGCTAPVGLGSSTCRYKREFEYNYKEAIVSAAQVGTSGYTNETNCFKWFLARNQFDRVPVQPADNDRSVGSQMVPLGNIKQVRFTTKLRNVKHTNYVAKSEKYIQFVALHLMPIDMWFNKKKNPQKTGW